jgi:hypothetical protein
MPTHAGNILKALAAAAALAVGVFLVVRNYLGRYVPDWDNPQQARHYMQNTANVVFDSRLVTLVLVRCDSILYTYRSIDSAEEVTPSGWAVAPAAPKRADDQLISLIFGAPALTVGWQEFTVAAGTLAAAPRRVVATAAAVAAVGAATAAYREYKKLRGVQCGTEAMRSALRSPAEYRTVVGLYREGRLPADSARTNDSTGLAGLRDAAVEGVRLFNATFTKKEHALAWTADAPTRRRGIRLTSACAETVSVAIRLKTLQGPWATVGWYVLLPHQTKWPEWHPASDSVYFFASSRSWVWPGNNVTSPPGLRARTVPLAFADDGSFSRSAWSALSTERTFFGAAFLGHFVLDDLPSFLSPDTSRRSLLGLSERLRFVRDDTVSQTFRC